MATYKSTGRICHISDVQSGTSKSGYEWQRLTLVLEIQGYHGSTTKQAFQVTGEDVDDILSYNVGEQVAVTWSLYAREWNGRWFNDVSLVKIELQEHAEQPAAATPARPQAEPAMQFHNPESLNPEDNPNDLPF